MTAPVEAGVCRGGTAPAVVAFARSEMRGGRARGDGGHHKASLRGSIFSLFFRSPPGPAQ